MLFFNLISNVLAVETVLLTTNNGTKYWPSDRVSDKKPSPGLYEFATSKTYEQKSFILNQGTIQSSISAFVGTFETNEINLTFGTSSPSFPQTKAYNEFIRLNETFTSNVKVDEIASLFLHETISSGIKILNLEIANVTFQGSEGIQVLSCLGDTCYAGQFTNGSIAFQGSTFVTSTASKSILNLVFKNVTRIIQSNNTFEITALKSTFTSNGGTVQSLNGTFNSQEIQFQGLVSLPFNWILWGTLGGVVLLCIVGFVFYLKRTKTK
jgi:hypothetical protein